MSLVRGENSLQFETGIDNSGLRQGTQQTQGILANLKSRVSSMAIFGGLAAAAVAAFGKIAHSATQMAADFEHAMKEVQTISDATSENFDKISGQLVQLSKEVPVESMTKLSEAFYQVVSAGYDGAKGMEVLEVAAKSATAGVTDTKTAADGLTTVLNAWGKEAGKAEEVSDVLFKTVKNGKTTIDELSQNFSEVAPLAASSGVSFREVAAAFSTLTKQGVPTAQAATQIRGAIEGLNRSMGDSWSKSMSLQEAFQKVSDEANGTFNGIRESMKTIEGVKAVLAMTGDQFDASIKDFKAMKDASGSMNEAFDKMGDSAKNQFQVLQNHINATIKPLGDAILEAGGKFAEFANDILEQPVEEKLREEQAEVNALVTELQEANTSEERRRDIMKELNSIAPSVVEGIDNENIALGKLNDQLDEYNKKMSKKMVLASLKEQEKEELADIAELREKKQKIEQEARQSIGRLITSDEGKEVERKLGIDWQEELTGTLKENILTIEEKFKEIKGTNPFTSVAYGVSDVAEHLHPLRHINALIEEQQQDLPDLQERIKALKDELLSMEDEQEDKDKGPDEKNKDIGPDEENIKKKVEITRQLREEIEGLPNEKKVDVSIGDYKEAGTQIDYDKIYEQYKDENLQTIQSAINSVESLAQESSGKLKEEYEGVYKYLQELFNNKLKKSVSELSYVLRDVGYVIGRIDEDLGKMIDSVGQVVKGIEGISSAESFSEGLSSATSIFDAIVTMTQMTMRSTKEMVKATKEQNKLLDEQAGKRRSNIDALKEQRRNLDASVRSWEQKLSDLEEGNVGSQAYDLITGRQKKYNDQLEEQRKKLKEVREELRMTLRADMTGGKMADKLANELMEAKGHLKDFEEYTNDIMRQIGQNLLKEQLTSIVQPLSEEIDKYMKEDSARGMQITTEELEKIRETSKKVQSQAQSFMRDWERRNFFDEVGWTGKDQEEMGTDKRATSMSGAVKRIQEETASAIEGQLNGIRIDVKNQISIQTVMQNHLAAIEQNTSYNYLLQEINEKLDKNDRASGI